MWGSISNVVFFLFYTSGDNLITINTAELLQSKIISVIQSCTTRECDLNFPCEGELVCQIEEYFVIPMFKDPLSNLIDLFLKTCLVLKNKSIKLKVINRVINFK